MADDLARGRDFQQVLPLSLKPVPIRFSLPADTLMSATRIA